ncbi:pimeloyl-ACP methyl ester esterase BioH [Vibrio barjaei]|jgi:pimeloyl-[acyl-carrier protein] methyl ester esterase|uniref:Pimeloyl-[acyl-carrier protein] methyl ester esterase n=1 Tax=Vibrio barjaei TaxID=1676683 RepID=A0ABW7IHI4_9VIBR|nr:pimeloyl-ACP methyl ester esterase BioH [Vibrio barjaei]OIN28380.1 pimeloyl-[acyl-carrier protein] methyl ester esterase [Vibrio barjaei]
MNSVGDNVSSASKVHWHSEGQGPDIVLLHGWGMNGAVWSKCSAELAQSFTVHSVDLPGYGFSHDVEYQSLEQFCELLLADAPDKAIWLGWSLGGLVATHIAHYYPQRISQLVTLASSPKFSEGEQWRGIKKDVLAAFTEQLTENFKLTIERFMALQAMGSPSARQDVKQLKEAVLSRPMPSQKALMLGLNWLDSLDLRQQLGELSMPVHRWYGRLDGLVPVRVAKQLDGLTSGHQSHVFKDSSHAPFITEQSSFIDKVQALVR